jgi:hypothetical protein
MATATLRLRLHLPLLSLLLHLLQLLRSITPTVL